MNNQVLEKVIGEYGILHFVLLDTYNVVNLTTKEIMPVMNFSDIEEAESYINSL